MTNTQDKTPAPVAAGTGENENLGRDIPMSTNSTPCTTVDAKTDAGTTKPRTWHHSAGVTDDGRARGLCGWTSRSNYLRARSMAAATATGSASIECRDCREIMEMQHKAVLRRERAEAIAELILRRLEDQEADR